MEFLRSLSLTEILALFAALFVVLIVAVLLTTSTNQPEVVDYLVTTPTPFIDHSNTPIPLDNIPIIP